MSMYTKQDVMNYLKQANRRTDLNEWEKKFIESIERQYALRALSAPQLDNLHRIAVGS